MLLYFCSFTTFSEESSVAHKRIILQKCFSSSRKHFQVSKNIFHRLENFSKSPKTFFIASKTLQSFQKRFSSSRKLFEVSKNVFHHPENFSKSSETFFDVSKTFSLFIFHPIAATSKVMKGLMMLKKQYGR